MEIARINSRALRGIEAPPVVVEVHLSPGLPAMSIVGLPETAVRESRDRVRSALLTNRFEFPAKRITVSLAPADLPKEGARFDLAIAIGILAASRQIDGRRLDSHEFIAELALTGELRPVDGILPAAVAARDAGSALLVARGNADEAAMVRGLCVHGAGDLLQVCAHLQGEAVLGAWPEAEEPARGSEPAPDLGDVRGQQAARRALEIAAAGRHNLLLIGPPGTGKTMLAERLPGILPPLGGQESLEVAMVASVSRAGFDAAHFGRRPVRAPHHTASAAALVGGGTRPRPGEISLAHHGVLFLDELPEFDRRVLEVLREPMECGRVRIARASGSVCYPADFQLLAAMNPCPCGYLSDPAGRCRCSGEQVARYRRRVSGPLLDRIDMQVEMHPSGLEILDPAPDPGAHSAAVRERVQAALACQQQRAGTCNGRLSAAGVRRHCRLDARARAVLADGLRALGLSARAVHRVLKVARTIADLDASESIAPPHLMEALSYRRLERAAPH